MAFDRRETAILLIGDLLVLAASLWAALSLRNFAIPSPGYFEHNFVPFLPMFLISLAVFYIAGLYEKQTRPIRSVMGIRILGAQAANVVIAAVLFFILPLAIAPKTILAIYLAVSVCAVSAWRFYRMGAELASSVRTPALLAGQGAAVDELFEEVNGNTRYLLRFSHRLDTAGLSDVAAAVERAIGEGVRAIVLDTHDAAIAAALPRLADRMARGTRFIEFSALYEEIFDRVPLDHIGIDRVLESLPKERGFYDLAKRGFDLVLAALASLIALPFILIGALFLYAQGGQPFIRHERVGRGGAVFRIVKLRTMLFNDHGDPALQKENRVTALGKVLRKTRIDELPQLWNILAGELSFIGPRPELPTIAAVYEREIPYYRMRHLIAPGLSGWAQIHDYDAPRGPADVARTRRKLSLDLYYLKHRSFALDLAIALKTFRALIAFSGT